MNNRNTLTESYIDGIYTYFDADGNPVARKLKLVSSDGKKKFAWEHLNDDGDWVKGRNGHKSLFIMDPTRPVTVIVEGEKDTLTLWHGGNEPISAASLPDGAGSTDLSVLDPLLEQDEPVLFILCDRDEPGRAHARRVYEYLKTAHPGVRIVEPWYGKDISAQVDGYNTPADLWVDPVASLLKTLRNVEELDLNEWKASCPVPSHGKGNGDENPSLSVGVRESGFGYVVHCHGGCDDRDVLTMIEGLLHGRVTDAMYEWRASTKTKKAKKLKAKTDAKTLIIRPGADIPSFSVKTPRELLVGGETIDKKTRKRVQERLADEIAKSLITASTFTPPETWADGRDFLEADFGETIYTIDQFHEQGGSTLIPAVKKTGKTTLLLNLVKSLCDGVPFLGEYQVNPPEGGIAFWNYELTKKMFQRWLREMDIQHPERSHFLNLRGQNFYLTDPAVFKWAVEWLKEKQVGGLVIDTYRRSFPGDENHNTEVSHYTERLEELKAKTDVQDLWLSAHAGTQAEHYGENDTGENDRARGASALEGWYDFGWVLAKRGKTRMLHVKGRDLELSVALGYDKKTRALRVTGTAQDALQDQKLYQVVAMVRDNPTLDTDDKDGRQGITTTNLKNMLKQKHGGDTGVWDLKLQEARQMELINHQVPGKTIKESPGKGNTAYYIVAEEGHWWCQDYKER